MAVGTILSDRSMLVEKYIMKTCSGNIQRFFFSSKIENVIRKKKKNNMFAKNIDCGCTLEPPRRDGSNEYPQSMFWFNNKKKGITLRYNPVYSSFTI